MISYQCIGKLADGFQCKTTSTTPSNPAKPEWGFLCSDCANEPPRRPQGRHASFLTPEADAEAENASAVLEDFAEFERDVEEASADV